MPRMAKQYHVRLRDDERQDRQSQQPRHQQIRSSQERPATRDSGLLYGAHDSEGNEHEGCRRGPGVVFGEVRQERKPGLIYPGPPLRVHQLTR